MPEQEAGRTARPTPRQPVLLGASFQQQACTGPATLHTFRYNFKPESLRSGSWEARLCPPPRGKEAWFLEYPLPAGAASAVGVRFSRRLFLPGVSCVPEPFRTPSAHAQQEQARTTTYSAVEAAGRDTDCVIWWCPDRQSWVLDRVASGFHFQVQRDSQWALASASPVPASALPPPPASMPGGASTTTPTTGEGSPQRLVERVALPIRQWEAEPAAELPVQPSPAGKEADPVDRSQEEGDLDSALDAAFCQVLD